MKLYTSFIGCLLFGICGQSFAYIITIIRWEKDGQKVIGCADVHDAAAFAANFSQWKFLTEHLGLLDRNKTCVLVEDAGACGLHGQHAVECEGMTRFVPQDYVIEMLKKVGIEVINLEYRHRLFEALLPFIVRHEDTAVKAQDVVKEFDAQAALLKTYENGEQLSQFYQCRIDKIIDQNEVVLNSLRQFPGTITEWIRSTVPPEKQESFARGLRLFDSRILDLIAIHQIIQRPNIGKILIFAGARHITHIGNALVNCRGFQQVSSIGIDLGMDELGKDVPAAELLNQFTPLPAEKLKALFE